MLSHDSTPDLVIYNGAINTLHAALPRCTALASKHGRIVALQHNYNYCCITNTFSYININA